MPNTPASGSPHTEDSRHPIPHWTLWRVSFGTGEAKRSFDGKIEACAVLAWSGMQAGCLVRLGSQPVRLSTSTRLPLRPQNPTSAMPTDAALKILLNAERRHDGSLLTRAPPAVPGRGCS